MQPARAIEATSRASRRIEQLSRSFAAGVATSDGRASATASPASMPSSPAYRIPVKGISGDVIVRRIDIAAKTFDLSTIYDSYSQGLYGVLMRSHAYWREFVTTKLGTDGIWAAFAGTPTEAGGEAPMIAYVAVVEKRGDIKVAEYGAVKDLCSNGALFDALVSIAVYHNSGVERQSNSSSTSETSGGNNNNNGVVIVECPIAVTHRLDDSTQLEENARTSDTAWMYRLRPSLAGQDDDAKRRRHLAPQAYIPTLREAVDKNLHAIWFTDAF